MKSVEHIHFDRTKGLDIDFEIIPYEKIFEFKDLNHDPQKAHRVDFYILILITSGSGKHTIDFKEYNFKKGSLLTIRKDQIHSFTSGASKGDIILFTEEFVVSYLDQPSALKIPELFNELLYDQITQLNTEQELEFSTIVSQMKDEFNKELDEHSPSILRNLLQVLVAKIHRIRSTSKKVDKHHKYMNQFLSFQKLVEQHCTKSRSVKYYADQLHLTTKTLNNITHKTIGNSPKEVIDTILAVQIKRQLINSSLSIKEIAYQSGFDEPSNLFKFFKRTTNQTPESFRSSYGP